MTLRERIEATVPLRIRMYVLSGVLALAGLLFAWKSTALFRRPVPAPPMQAAHEARAVSGLEKHELAQPVKVNAYDKGTAVRKLSLPAEVASNPNQQVISTAELKPSEGGYVTATVLDTQTGEATTRFTEKPRPLIALGGQTEAGLRYGVSTRDLQQFAVYARQDLLRISNLHLAGYAEVNAGAATAPEAKAMIDISLRW